MSSGDFPLRFTISVSGDTQAIQAFRGLGQAAGQMSTQVQGAATGAQTASRQLDSVGDVAARSQSKMQRFASGIASFGVAVAGITSLASAIDNVGDATDRLHQKQTRLARANEAVDQATKKVAEAIAKYGANSVQAADAQDNLNIALSRQQDAVNGVKNAMEDVTFAQANLASSFITTGAGIAGMVASFANVSASSRLAQRGLEGVAETGRSMTFKMGAIGAILAGIGLALAAVGTNFMGFRDALDGIGKAIGEALPGLKPFLEGIRGMASIMGLTGDKMGQTATAAEDLGQGSMEAAQGLSTMGAATRQSTSDLGQLQAQYFSTLNQIKKGAALGPGGIIGSKEALQRMGIPSSEILQGAAAEAALAVQKGFATVTPTITTKTDNTQLNQGVDQAKAKIAEISTTPDLRVKVSLDTSVFVSGLEQLLHFKFPEIKVPLLGDTSPLGMAFRDVEAMIPPRKSVPIDADRSLLDQAIQSINDIGLSRKDVPIGADKSLFDSAVAELANMQWPELPQIKIPEVDFSGLITSARAAFRELEQIVGETVNRIIRALSAIRGVIPKGSVADRALKQMGFRHGGTAAIWTPTAITVGEGFHPEFVQRIPMHMAAKGFGGFVNRPTMFMAGEAGPELVNVIPLKNGSGGGSSGNDALLAKLDKLISLQRRSMEANLIVDGQRMAAVAQKYTGMKSYGDR